MRLSASRLDLAAECLWWARPDVTVPDVPAGKAAELGTAAHSEFESAAEAERDLEERWRRIIGGAISQETEQDGPLFELVNSWNRWWSSKRASFPWYATEVPFALDPMRGTSRVLPSNGQRDYSAALESEICGTADLVVVSNDGQISIIDYKTGRGPHRATDHERQLRFLATAAGLAYGSYNVYAAALHVTPDDAIASGMMVDALDMGTVRHELAMMHGRIAGGPEARPGIHCDDMYCKAMSVCPATRALFATAGVTLDDRTRLPVVGPITSNAQAYSTLVAMPLVQAWLDQRSRDARAYADEHGGIEAPDGRVYAGKDATRETPILDVSGAEPAMRAVLGTFADDAIKVERSTSWLAIEKAIKARKASGAKLVIKEEKEHVRAALREAGALKISKYPVYDWRKADS